MKTQTRLEHRTRAKKLSLSVLIRVRGRFSDLVQRRCLDTVSERPIKLVQKRLVQEIKS